MYAAINGDDFLTQVCADVVAGIIGAALIVVFTWVTGTGPITWLRDFYKRCNARLIVKRCEYDDLAHPYGDKFGAFMITFQCRNSHAQPLKFNYSSVQLVMEWSGINIGNDAEKWIVVPVLNPDRDFNVFILCPLIPEVRSVVEAKLKAERHFKMKLSLGLFRRDGTSDAHKFEADVQWANPMEQWSESENSAKQAAMRNVNFLTIREWNERKPAEIGPDAGKTKAG